MRAEWEDLGKSLHAETKPRRAEDATEAVEARHLRMNSCMWAAASGKAFGTRKRELHHG